MMCSWKYEIAITYSIWTHRLSQGSGKVVFKLKTNLDIAKNIYIIIIYFIL